MDDRLRLRYGKTGKAKYISHLDLTSAMRRALLRAGVELKYSSGFNPHPYLSVALPLPVGCGSICELMDVGVDARFSTNVPLKAINAALPEGIEVFEAYTPERKFNAIAWVNLEGVLYYDNGIPPGAVSMLSELFRSECIIIQKKTKRGLSDIDIAQYIRDVEFHANGTLTMKAAVSAQDPTISPENLLSAMESPRRFAPPPSDKGGELAPDHALFTRMEIFDSEFNIFR